MKDISSVSDFLYVSNQLADYVVENGLNNCSTESNYIFDFHDVSHLISASDYKRYLPLIADWIAGRDEVLDIDISTGNLDIIYAEKYLELYADDLGYQKSMDVGKWHVELLDKNDPYGNFLSFNGELLDRPVWDSEKLGIVFYDTSQDPAKFPNGQFTYTYYVDTLLGTDGYGTRAQNGLRMDLDIPEWTVKKEEMEDILHWLDKVVETRTIDTLCTGKEELGLKLHDGNYFYIQTCDDGWDYTLYNTDFFELDGGQLDETSYTMAEAIKEILKELDYPLKNIISVALDEFFERVNEAEEKQFAALYNKILKAEDKFQMQDHSRHIKDAKETLERT